MAAPGACKGRLQTARGNLGAVRRPRGFCSRRLVQPGCTPVFFSDLRKKKTGRARSKRKAAWTRSGAVALPRATGVGVSVPAPIWTGLRARYALLRFLLLPSRGGWRRPRRGGCRMELLLFSLPSRPKNPAARSAAERAEREADQMRPCTPLTFTPAPRESAFKPVPHPRRARREVIANPQAPSLVNSRTATLHGRAKLRLKSVFLLHRARRVLFWRSIPGTSWWCSRASPAPASPPWPSTPSMPRASGGMWSPSAPTPGCSWARWRSPTWTISTASPPPSPSTRRPPAKPPLHRGHRDRDLRLPPPAVGPGGHPHCPKCGKEIRQQTIDQIIDQVLAACRRAPASR